MTPYEYNGWNRNGEFHCLCGTVFGKNLKGDSPFALVAEHRDVCPQLQEHKEKYSDPQVQR